jgi:hypothetical protein
MTESGMNLLTAAGGFCQWALNSVNCRNVAITLKTPNRVVRAGAPGKNRAVGGRILPLSDTWSLAKAVRKVEFKPLQMK